MKTKRLIELNLNEYIVTAYANPTAGPGWSNSPIWVVIADKLTGKWREDCLQPEEQTAEMFNIYGFSALAHSKMTSLVEKIAVQTNEL